MLCYHDNLQQSIDVSKVMCRIRNTPSINNDMINIAAPLAVPQGNHFGSTALEHIVCCVFIYLRCNLAHHLCYAYED